MCVGGSAVGNSVGIESADGAGWVAGDPGGDGDGEEGEGGADGGGDDGAMLFRRELKRLHADCMP